MMHQTWGKLLFLHWRIGSDLLRPHVPPGLEVDTFEGDAWISVAPFTISGIRPPMLPAVPVLSESYELNVRTYVHRGGVPGVWFFSLDASNPLAVATARLAFHLPYYRAEMALAEEGPDLHFTSRRVGGEGPAMEFEARWSRLTPLAPSQPDSLDFFLVERYCLYSVSGAGDLYRARIHHRPWPLREARLRSIRSTMLSGQGLPGGVDEPLLHAQGDPLGVEIWPPEKVSEP